MTEDFDLWTRRFESYCRAAKVADALKCNVLLAALDDDALGLSGEVWSNYSQLMVALKEHSAPTTCSFELRFCLKSRIQQEESLDDFDYARQQNAS